MCLALSECHGVRCAGTSDVPRQETNAEETGDRVVVDHIVEFWILNLRCSSVGLVKKMLSKVS